MRRSRTRTAMVMIAGAFAIGGLPAIAAAQDSASAQATTEKNEPRERSPELLKKYKLGKDNLAISGYDPVAYFPEGTPGYDPEHPEKTKAKPTKGSKDLELVYAGVRYRFSTRHNMELFRADPERYEPAYGGWCAYAMAKEDYTAPNPKRFIIQNGRLMLFYDGILGDTLKSWNKEGAKELEPLADEFWENESGEKPPADDNQIEAEDSAAP